MHASHEGNKVLFEEPFRDLCFAMDFRHHTLPEYIIMESIEVRVA